MILAKTRSHGFTFVQVKLLGQGYGTGANAYGEMPWFNGNPLTPNEAYFRNVDAVVQAVAEEGLILLLTIYHQKARQFLTAENGRAWGKWLAKRYRDAPHLLWTMTPEAKDEFVPVLREIAAGLLEGDGGKHLITFKPDPSPFSSSFLHNEKWLSFNCIQTWNAEHLIYPLVTHDYNLKPVKPVVMTEGAYEAGEEYGFEVTPLWIRRQAYYSYLAGAHHGYGHSHAWRMPPMWKEALDAPGARQMGIVREFLTDRSEWWLLAPDQSILTAGGQVEGYLLHLAARHQDGRWVMVYLADKAEFSVDMGKLSGAKVNGLWCNPKTGETSPAGAFANTGVGTFSTPDGWEDALLVLENAAAQPAKARQG